MDRLEYLVYAMEDYADSHESFEDIAGAVEALMEDEDFGFLAEPLTDLLEEECAVCGGPIDEFMESSVLLERIMRHDICCHDVYPKLRETADSVQRVSFDHIFLCGGCLPK